MSVRNTSHEEFENAFSLVGIALYRWFFPSPATGIQAAVATGLPAAFDRAGAAEYLGVSLTTFDRLRAKLLIPDRYIDGNLRFLRKDLDAYLKKVENGEG